ncbi:MAG: sodium-dependent transporter [Solobacterium sp.]|nr:sodium-dependent transporter [Solobacterium sp.]MCH4048230.1 sodium-dependent transporter [Solobacterium sp.]MCH4074916.1 sodium-dependent transporter [Solobacterium sp.]MCI1314026.1 sodium-dependent transporter [Solobacterium sp.]MCI1346081.1 sodium-dependent transporter [Solobacterium sp.]
MKKEQHKQKQRASFSGRIGYVLAAAGSAIGLGNIWRFPYLAAKYGGGIFLFIYIILTLTFGYTMIISETALGRMTKSSPIGAFRKCRAGKGLQAGGWINAVIPMLIVPYYSVIGGWVLKYLVTYVSGHGAQAVSDSFFTSFISSSSSVVLYFVLFSAMVFAVILAGVQKGVENISRILMPVLLILAVFVAVYSVSRPGALAGVKYFLIPNWKDFSWMTFVAAMGQMFYSLSIAMGILYTYGSYLTDDVDIDKSTGQLEFFDTFVAVLAGLMIIPSVFSFFDGDISKLQAGPSLTFITLPQVFGSMRMGSLMAVAFFLMFLLAALTSAISLMETSINTFEDELHLSRPLCCVLMAVIMAVIGISSSLGYGVWGNVKIIGMAILDFFDFLTNSIMMPVAALATCTLILGKVGFEKIDEEVEHASSFGRKKLYHFCLKYLAPVFILLILISSIANAAGWISM